MKKITQLHSYRLITIIILSMWNIG